MALTSESWAWIASKRRWMALPKYLTDSDTNGSGIRDSSVSRASIEIISASAAANPRIVFAEYMTAGPIIMRTAFRSLVARDIRSPVRCAWKYADRKPLQVGEEVVADVVLDVAGGADQDAAHEKAEDPADQAYREQQRRHTPPASGA